MARSGDDSDLKEKICVERIITTEKGLAALANNSPHN